MVKGTSDMVRRAGAAGIEVREIAQDGLVQGCEGGEGEGISDYWVKKDGKNKRAYVLDANGKPRSRICDGAHFTNRADVIAHAMKFGGTPMVVIDIHGTSCPIELGSNSAHSVH